MRRWAAAPVPHARDLPMRRQMLRQGPYRPEARCRGSASSPWLWSQPDIFPRSWIVLPRMPDCSIVEDLFHRLQRFGGILKERAAVYLSLGKIFWLADV